MGSGRNVSRRHGRETPPLKPAALEQDRLREGKPLLGDHPFVERMLAVNLAAFGGVWALTRDLDVRQRQRTWRAVALLRLAAAGWNLRQSGCACFRLSF